MKDDLGTSAHRPTLTFATIVVASSLVGLMGFLLFDNYRAAAGLQHTLVERMHQETQRRLTSLDYFFGERRNDLARLARSREVGVFFENRALGMSLRYGLKQSLVPIRELLVELIDRKRIGGQTIYDRVVLLDETGDVLVDSDREEVAAGVASLPNCNRPQDAGGVIKTQDNGRSMVVSMPYRFKDSYAGQLVAWMDPSVVYEHLLGVEGEMQALAYLLAEPGESAGLRIVGGDPMPQWGALLSGLDPASAASQRDAPVLTLTSVQWMEPPGQMEVYASVFVLPRSELRLVELNRAEVIDGALNPWIQVLGMGALALLVLSGIVFVFRANLQSAVLKARLTESALREQQIQSKNDALKVEVAERRRAEEAMEQAKLAAESANQAKSDFLANMSHEIRTPMVGVIGMTGLLRDTRLSEQQKEYVETIRSSGDALLEVINDILDFSKIEANRMELEVTGFDLRTVVEEVADILALRAFEKGLNFNCLLVEGVPVRLRGDAGRLRQVLVNLTGNAIKFTEHGEVSLDVKRLDDGADPDQCLLRFEINDTGIGIAADRRSGLFDSFYQVDAGTTRRFGGTGLGLAISKQLVELMGGRIGCDSVEGVGSSFWVEIGFEVDAWISEPIDESAKVLEGKRVLIVDDNATNLRVLSEYLVRLFEFRHLPAPADCVALAAGSQPEAQVPLRILVAEDNPTNQKVAASMLKRLGHHADLVGNGGEALDALKLLPYDLVLMDVQMPEMDGLEATRRFRALERGTGRHLPIIAMTAHASLEDRERCLDAGMDDFITKPVQRDVLGRLIVANFETHKPEAVMSSDPKSNIDATTLSAEQPAAAQSDPGIAAASATGSGFTFDVMVERMDNDQEIAREIAEIFVFSSEELLVELAAAVSNRDAAVIRARAHSLKGSAGNIGASALQDLAGAMERAGRDGNLDEAEVLLPGLRASLEQVNGVLSNCG